jgi:hypothetical protein
MKSLVGMGVPKLGLPQASHNRYPVARWQAKIMGKPG